MKKLTRRALLGAGGVLAGGLAAGIGAVSLRGGAALLPGIARARPVQSSAALPAQVDVVVIGGGNVGCLTALTLAERGVSVVLCEKGVVAGEASGRSLGYIDSQFLDPAKMEIIGRSKELWAGLNERVSADTGYRRTGLATCFGDRNTLEGTQGWIDAVRGMRGVDAKLITSAELEKLAPDSKGRFAGALFQSTDATAEPTLAAPAIAEAIQRRGGSVLQRCAVRGIETSAGKVSAVVTERGRIACQAIVLAGGVWSPLLARTLGLDVPQFMAFGSVARTEGAPGPEVSMIAADQGVVMRRNVFGGYDVCKGIGIAPITPTTLRNLPRLKPALDNMWDQLRPVLNFSTFMNEWRIPERWALDAPSPFEANRILMPEINRPQLDGAIEAMQQVLPPLQRAKVVERWAGSLMSTLDNMPVVSPAGGVPGLFLGTGFYYGLTMAPAAGEALADLVMGQTPQIDLSLFRLSRFTDGSEIVFRA